MEFNDNIKLLIETVFVVCLQHFAGLKNGFELLLHH